MELVSEVPGDATRFSATDGFHTFRHWSELQHGTRGAAESRKVVPLSPDDSVEEEHTGLSLPVAKAHSAKKKAAKRSAPSGIAAPPPKRQCQAELQATVLARMEDFAGSLAALNVSRVALIPTPCSSSPAMCGIPAASRKPNSSALHEARTLRGVGVGTHRIRLSVKPPHAVHQKAMCLSANLSAFPKYLESSPRCWTSPEALAS